MVRFSKWWDTLWREDKDAVWFAVALWVLWLLVMAGGAW